MSEKPCCGMILIINVTRIGDTLLTTPAIRAIANAFPHHQIDFLGHPKRAEVIDHLPFVSNVGVITKNRAIWKAWLSPKKYDIAFVYGFDESLVSYALRISKKVVAFSQDNEKIDSQLYCSVDKRQLSSKQPMALRLMQLPYALGINPAGMRLSYFVTNEEADWARQCISRDLPEKATPLVGLQVVSFPTKSYRDWPVEYFIELCKKIIFKYENAHFLIFGGPGDTCQTAKIKSALVDKATVYAGWLTLRQTAALMSCIDLYIGVDTGPTHLMSTFDIPMVSLYHSTITSQEFGPLEHPFAHMIDHPNSGINANTEDSMKDISVEEVWSATNRLLEERFTKSGI